MVVDEDAQVCLDLLIDSFRLSISLGVIRRGEVSFNAEQLVQVLHELGVELGSSVMDDFLGNAVKSEDLVLVHLCHSFRCDRHVGGDGMDLLREFVHKDADSIVTLRFWQFSDQIHRDYLPVF